MYAPPTSLVPVTTSLIELLCAFSVNSSPPSGFSASCTGPWPTSSSASIRSAEPARASCFNWIATIWCPPLQAANAFDESGRITTSLAPGQPSITPRTVRVFVSIKLTELPPRLATARVLPSGATRTADGVSPVPITATSRRVFRSTTLTLFEAALATYATAPSGSSASAAGCRCTAITAATAFFSASITVTNPLPPAVPAFTT